MTTKSELIKTIEELRQGEIGERINSRLEEFKANGRGDEKSYYLEVCFGILAANTSSLMGQRVVKELGFEGFTSPETVEEMQAKLKSVSCRFNNMKGKYLFELIRLKDQIKKNLIVLDHDGKREWLHTNIKGIGLKESSHVLRNLGFFDFAIIDKHVQNLMVDFGLIKEKPKTMTPKKYSELERTLLKLAKQLDMEQGEMDMYLWYLKTGLIEK